MSKRKRTFNNGFPDPDKDGRRLVGVHEYANYMGTRSLFIPQYEGESMDELRDKYGLEFDREFGWGATNRPYPEDFLPEE